MRMLALLIAWSLTAPALAQDADPSESEPEIDPDLVASDIVVAGAAEEVFHTGGSAYVVSEEHLEEMNYDDPLSIVTSVPGVYVRQEDGYGLRPNIGIRGADAERSRRITLMEDDVLLGPAPYSAPAAYYFPLMTRMTGMEVFMGPAAIPYGPHTVGGAINFLSRPVPTHSEGGLDLALGTTWFGRFHGHYGTSNEWGGFVVEAVHLRTDGFRHLDFSARDDSTGFDRTDVQLRGELHGDLTRDIYHRLEVTAGLGLEGSNESYVGLSVADLRADPWRRYGIASTDRMEWWRTRAMVRYELTSDVFDLTVTGYRHDFQRTWQRVDGFRDGTSIAGVLNDPTIGRNAVYYGVLTGQDEATSPGQAVLVVRNHREFVSQGIQARGRLRVDTGEVHHTIELGVRLHYDEIVRRHTGTGWLVENRQLVSDGQQEALLTANRAQSIALSSYLAWQLRFLRFTVTPGIRLESIWGELDDRQTGQQVVTEQVQPLPGLGVTYEVIDDVALFAGVHQGYSPVAPGQPDGTRPELAWNFELGTRYGLVTAPTHAQLAFFSSEYENLTGECSGAGGCSEAMIDRQFNGGRVTILGIEANAAHTPRVDEVSFPLRISYTWTYTRFQTSFVSDNPQFGTVHVGDRLPYIPEHTLNAGVGFRFRFLEINTQLLYVGRMWDHAGQGTPREGDMTDDQVYLDATASVEVFDGIRLYVRGENLANQAPIVSYRPMGARTGRPLLFQAGLTADF